MLALQELGIALIIVIQQMSPGFDSIMEFITFFGIVEFYMIFIPFLYWLVNKRWGFRVFMILIFTDFVGTLIKLGLHQPRPYWMSDNVKLIGKEEAFYGFVSTHSSNPPAVLGYLALQVRKQWMWIIAITVPFLIGFSRMYLGVHFPHDVVGGWLVGILMLYVITKNEAKVVDWMSEKSSGYQIAVSFLTSLAFFVSAYIVSLLIANSPDSEAWARYSTEARTLDHFVTLAGSMFGTISGYILMKQSARFDVGGSAVQKAMRYVLGMVGVVGILEGLGAAFDAIQVSEGIDFILRYVRYGLTTFWAMYGAPWMFLKLKLAEAEA